jgi:peptidoglycan/LPS O-acetylase OafA/YrhL
MEGIRGLAILLVFFVHYHALFSPYVSSTSRTFRISSLAWGIGNSGVDLFFVLSGFLIYGAVISKPISYSRFLRRRVERIYPTFLAVFFLYIALSISLPGISKLPAGWWQSSKYILYNLLLLPGIFPIRPLVTVAWSLSYEFFFYITIPLLVALTAMRRWQRWHRVAFFLSLALLRFTVVPVLPIRMVMFTGGIVAYEALHTDWLKAKLRASEEAIVGAIFFASFLPVGLMTVWEDSVKGGWGNLIMWISFPLFLIYCVGRQGFLGRIFSWTPLRWMGNMSYSYYLVHGITVHGFKLICGHIWAADGNSPFIFWALLPFTIAATIITSTVLFWLVEKRFSLNKTAPVAVPGVELKAQKLIATR